MTKQNECPFSKEQIDWLKSNLGVELSRASSYEIKVTITLADEEVSWDWVPISEQQY